MLRLLEAPYRTSLTLRSSDASRKHTQARWLDDLLDKGEQSTALVSLTNVISSPTSSRRVLIRRHISPEQHQLPGTTQADFLPSSSGRCREIGIPAFRHLGEHAF